jgi:hypothetical protein
MRTLRLLGRFVGVVLIGVLGSALWEVVLHGLYERGSRFLLTLFTLGLDSMRNSIYADVARGHHEVPSLYLLMFFVVSVLAIPISIIVNLTLMSHIWPANLAREERQRLRPRLRRLIYKLTTFCFFVGVILLGRLITLNYTNLAITHFEHSLAICAPYLTGEEERAIRSQFALIKTSMDYEAVIRRLQAVAAQHEITLNEFTTW